MLPYVRIFQALREAGVRYLVAGGVAVNLHQVVRATVDLDLILHLEEKNILKFVRVMKDLGYTPRVPVAAEDLADPKKRRQWIEEKNMMVFSFIRPDNPMEIVDVFVKEPMRFASLDKRRADVEAFGLKIPVVGVADLIRIKRKAGRERDLYDISLLSKKRTP
ncbi:MAG TPA: hypothetical protein VLJ37_07050 [bacterium]|nr:hypothetical protein [bacterium]